MFSVELSQKAQKFLNQLNTDVQERIEIRFKKLKENPIPSDAKFICRDEGEKVFRYRIGDYRALYKVKEKDRIILIAKIDKRPRVYQNI